jgi:protocatechuate 3,4-dioxygenase, alpha subunit
MTTELTPSQTVGPFLHIGLPWPDGPFVVSDGAPGSIEITGQVLDGAGSPVPDALIETWQCDGAGRFAHPDDPRSAFDLRRPEVQAPGGLSAVGPRFRGFGRCPTGEDGTFRVVTVKPGPLPGPDGMEAPHIDVSIFARGLLDRVVTRIYFGDEAAANGADPVLSALPADRRETLVAVPGPGGYRFDIRLQGADETVFFDV